MEIQRLSEDAALLIDKYAEAYHVHHASPYGSDAELSREQEKLEIQRQELAHKVALGLCCHRGIHQEELEFLLTPEGEGMEDLPPFGWLDN